MSAHFTLLTVDDRCRRLAVAPGFLPAEGTKPAMNLLPEPSYSPLSKIVVKGLPVGEITKQHPPTDASPRHIEDGV